MQITSIFLRVGPFSCHLLTVWINHDLMDQCAEYATHVGERNVVLVDLSRRAWRVVLSYKHDLPHPSLRYRPSHPYNDHPRTEWPGNYIIIIYQLCCRFKGMKLNTHAKSAPVCVFWFISSCSPTYLPSLTHSEQAFRHTNACRLESGPKLWLSTWQPASWRFLTGDGVPSMYPVRLCHDLRPENDVVP